MVSFVSENLLHSFQYGIEQFLATFCDFIIMVPDQNYDLYQLVQSCTIFWPQSIFNCSS